MTIAAMRRHEARAGEVETRVNERITMSASGIRRPGATPAVQPLAVDGALTAGWIRTILARVSEGCYDHPEIQRAIAEKLFADLQSRATD